MSVANYAKALYAIAEKQNKIDLITDQFGLFRDAMEDLNGWISMMDSPMITFDEKKEKLEALDYDASFLAFLSLLAQKHHVHLYLEIYHEWLHMSRKYQGIAYLHIYSAAPITQEQEIMLRKVIQPRFPKQTLDFNITVDEHLLGGIKIVHQGQSLDRSIARELKELYTTI